jgi:hypothetical protein
MERARLAFQRGSATYYNGVPEFALTSREMFIRDPHSTLGFRHAAKHIERRQLEKSGPPIDLKAYIVAREYDPAKRRFPKVIAELAKHKDQLHPHMRRYLIERMRQAEDKHRKLAEQYGTIADQFD